MSTPNYHMGALKNVSKREMAARFPGVYSYTVVCQGWVCRYVSDEPSVAEAEAWLVRIIALENSPQSWCVIHRMDDEHVLFVSGLKDVIQKAVRCLPMDIDAIVLQRSDSVFITHSQDAACVPEGKEHHLVEPLTDSEQAPFTLKKQSGHAWVIPAVLVGVLAVGGVSYYMMQPPPPPVMVDPYLVYKQSVSNAVAAESVLLNAASLGAYAALLPDGWPLEDIRLSGQQLILTTKREELGERPIINAWLDANPALEKYAVVGWNGMNITVPMPETLSDWQHQITKVNPLTDNFKDRLIAMGWSISDATTVPGVTSQSMSFIAKKNSAVLADLQSIAKWTVSLPVGISDLTMTQTSLGRYSTSLTLTVIGAPS